MLDDGMAPPLCPRALAASGGGTLGSEAEWPGGCVMPGGGLSKWKAAAIIGMLERRAGEDSFRKFLSRVVSSSPLPPASPPSPSSLSPAYSSPIRPSPSACVKSGLNPRSPPALIAPLPPNRWLSRHPCLQVQNAEPMSLGSRSLGTRTFLRELAKLSGIKKAPPPLFSPSCCPLLSLRSAVFAQMIDARHSTFLPFVPSTLRQSVTRGGCQPAGIAVPPLVCASPLTC